MGQKMKPNIIIFNPDQWRGDVLRHMGNPAAVTPCLDQAVQSDFVSFRNAFCQNPVCTPSRCSYMTGWYPHVRGHRTMHYMLRQSENEPNLLRTLKDNGYYIWWGGKNDLVPAQEGFSAICDEKFVATDEDFIRWKKRKRAMFARDRMAAWRGSPEGDNYYSFFAGLLETEEDEDYFDNDWACLFGALEFIEKAEALGKPYCLFLPLVYPHPPYAVEKKWYDKISPERIPQRPVLEDWSGKASILREIYERQGLKDWSEARWTELRRVYYAMCARVDAQFGLLLEKLKETEQYDKSAIFLFSDHGDYTGDYGISEKNSNTFEDCVSRVPFLIKPPRGHTIQAGVSDALVELIDFPATCYHYADISPGYDHFGISLDRVIAGEIQVHRDAVFCEGGRRVGEKQAAVAANKKQDLTWPRGSLQSEVDSRYHTKAIMCRNHRYKYIKRLYEEDELYDLENDPSELHNLSGDVAYGGVLEEMKERLLKHYMETCDIVPHQLDRR